MRTATLEAFKPADFGGRPDQSPDYYKFGTSVTKFHKLPRTPENIAAHAAELFKQLATKQRAQLAKAATPEVPCPCASGTWSDDPAVILRAVVTRQRAQLARALEADHSARTDYQVGKALAAALAGKPLRGLVIDIRDDNRRARR